MTSTLEAWLTIVAVYLSISGPCPIRHFRSFLNTKVLWSDETSKDWCKLSGRQPYLCSELSAHLPCKSDQSKAFWAHAEVDARTAVMAMHLMELLVIHDSVISRTAGCGRQLPIVLDGRRKFASQLSPKCGVHAAFFFGIFLGDARRCTFFRIEGHGRHGRAASRVATPALRTLGLGRLIDLRALCALPLRRRPPPSW